MATIDLIVVGGGGSGGRAEGSVNANGGDAGQYNANSSFTVTAQDYPVTVGTGGNGTSGGNQNGNAGTSSTGFGYTSTGGNGGSYSGTGIDGSGVGTSNSISGSSVTYSIGGGHETAQKNNTTYGSGSDGRNSVNSTNGINGVVIVAFTIGGEVSCQSTGGTITQSGGKQIHTFTSNGTFTVVLNPILIAQVQTYSLTFISAIFNYGRYLFTQTNSYSLTFINASFILRLYRRFTNQVKTTINPTNIKKTLGSIYVQLQNGINLLLQNGGTIELQGGNGNPVFTNQTKTTINPTNIPKI